MEANFQGVKPEQRNTYRRRLREAIRLDLMDAAYFAGTYPEDQLRQVLTPQNLTLVFQALTGQGCEKISARHYEIAKTMLRIAATRLQVLIPDYSRPTLIREIEDVVHLLTFVPTEEKTQAPSTWKAQRDKMKKQRQTIILRQREEDITEQEPADGKP